MQNNRRNYVITKYFFSKTLGYTYSSSDNRKKKLKIVLLFGADFDSSYHQWEQLIKLD